MIQLSPFISKDKDTELFDENKENFIFNLLVFLRQIQEENKEKMEKIPISGDLTEKEFLEKLKRMSKTDELKSKLDKDFVDYLINCLGLFD